MLLLLLMACFAKRKARKMNSWIPIHAKVSEITINHNVIHWIWFFHARLEWMREAMESKKRPVPARWDWKKLFSFNIKYPLYIERALTMSLFLGLFGRHYGEITSCDVVGPFGSHHLRFDLHRKRETTCSLWVRLIYEVGAKRVTS